MSETGTDARADTAARVWNGMRTLVLDLHDKRDEVCEALGMSFIRAKALRRLAKGPRTMRELAAELATDAPYTTLVVDDLQRRGLVERTVHPADRRARIVTATPEGLAAAGLAERILGEPPAPLLDLTGTDLETLDRIVTALLATPPG
jgi:DNA-binding MarR family transcriptional regulator